MSEQIKSLDQVQRLLGLMVQAQDPNERLALSAMIRTKLQAAYQGESANDEMKVCNPNIIMEDDE